MLNRTFRKLFPKMRTVGSIINSSEPREATQAFHDSYAAAILLRGYKHMKAMDSKAKLTQEDVDKFYEEINSMEERDMDAFVQDQLNSQMVSIFECIHSICEDMKTMATFNRFENDASVFAHKVGQSKLVDGIGYRSVVKPSSIENAGNGLFLECKDQSEPIPPGSIVGIFPGLVHLKEFITTEYVMETLLPDPDMMLLARHDGHVIDSRTTDHVPFNPFGVAHFTNHVPQSSRPNVFQIPFDLKADSIFAKSFPPHLKPYVPNLYAKKPTIVTFDRSTAMQMVILITSAPVRHGQELFMDYRLNTEAALEASQVPSWYIPTKGKYD